MQQLYDYIAKQVATVSTTYAMKQHKRDGCAYNICGMAAENAQIYCSARHARSICQHCCEVGEAELPHCTSCATLQHLHLLGYEGRAWQSS